MATSAVKKPIGAGRNTAITAAISESVTTTLPTDCASNRAGDLSMLVRQAKYAFGTKHTAPAASAARLSSMLTSIIPAPMTSANIA